MEKYKVLISFPGSTVDDPEAQDTIQLVGSEANCQECHDHLLNLLEEYKQEMEERNERDALVNSFHTPRNIDFGAALGGKLKDTVNGEEMQEPDPWAETGLTNGGSEEPMRNGKQGFVVPGAPWTQEAPNMLSRTDFPSMGASGGHSASLSAWGPKRS